MCCTLLGELVLEFHRKDGEPIDAQHQVDRLVWITLAVVQLTHYGELVLPIECLTLLAQR